jgi:hypothetical protein
VIAFLRYSRALILILIRKSPVAFAKREVAKEKLLLLNGLLVCVHSVSYCTYVTLVASYIHCFISKHTRSGVRLCTLYALSMT